MSFGYGVGDAMAVSRLALKVCMAYKDAPGDYRDISDEVESLHIIIDKAAQHFESATLSDNSRQEGQKVLRGCHNVLGDLDALMEKYNSLASASTSTGTSQLLQRLKLSASLVIGTEDISTLRARLTSNTTLLNGFIQRFDIPTIMMDIILILLHSCEFDKIQARFDSVLGLNRTMSRDSVVSFAGSINTKRAYKKFCKGLFNIGVTAEMISQKEKEIQDMFKSQNPGPSNQMDDSTSADPNPTAHPQLPEVGNSSDAETSLISTMPIENLTTQSRFGWVRPPIDFLVGPLMLSAVEAGNTARLASILGYVRNINYANSLGQTALHKAARNGRLDVVELLLLQGASIEATDFCNSTPLSIAAGKGHTSIVEPLLSKGASIDAMNKYNNTPLHSAAYNGHTSTTELLLSKGAPINTINDVNRTPLHQAANGGYTRIVELLLSKGASVKAQDKDGHTPLHDAARNGYTSTVELLLSKGASIDAMNNDNSTPLHRAALGGHTSTVELLLSKGASIDAMNSHNSTPLLNAAYRGYTRVVELLLSKGASIKAKDKDDDTPLHEAARNGHTSMVELLLSKDASIAAVNQKKQTPLDLATSKRHTDAIKLLKNKACQS